MFGLKFAYRKMVSRVKNLTNSGFAYLGFELRYFLVKLIDRLAVFHVSQLRHHRMLFVLDAQPH